MKLNIPLLPLSVEFCRRPLPRPRLSIRHLLVLVLVSAGFLGLVAELRRHDVAMKHYHSLMFEVVDRKSSLSLVPLWLRDQELFNQHQSAHEAVELMLLLYTLAVGTAVTAFVFGRVVARSGERPGPNGPAV